MNSTFFAPSLTLKLTPDIQAYGINRTEHDANGYHERRRSSVDLYLEAAPPTGARGHRYPKRHRNTERHYDTEEELYEFPTMDYPYSEQNARGRVRRRSPGGTFTEFSPGYTRTITNANKDIQGLSYHPKDNPRRHVRAQEIYPRNSSRR